MKSSIPIIALLIAFQTLHCTAQESATQNKKKTANPNGSWRLEYDWNGQHVQDVYRLKKGKKNSVTGTLSRNEFDHEIENGKLDGDKISFTVKAVYEGSEWVVDYEGKITGDSLEGTATVKGDGQTMDLPWTPKRSVEMDDVVGTWNLTIDSPDGNRFTPKLKLTKEGNKLVSHYDSPAGGGEIELENLRVEENELRFTLNTEFQGTPLHLEYRGRPYGHEIDGTIEYDMDGNTGEMPFTAKREAAKKKKKDE